MSLGTVTVQETAGDVSTSDRKLAASKSFFGGSVGDTYAVSHNATPFGYTFVYFVPDTAADATLEETAGDVDTDEAFISVDSNLLPSNAQVGDTLDALVLQTQTGSSVVIVIVAD